MDNNARKIIQQVAIDYQYKVPEKVIRTFKNRFETEKEYEEAIKNAGIKVISDNYGVSDEDEEKIPHHGLKNSLRINELVILYQNETSWELKSKYIDEIIERIHFVVARNARKQAMYNRSAAVDYLDLVQEGRMTVLDVLDKYKPEKGIPFTSYVEKCINRKIARTVISNKTLLSVKYSQLSKMIKIEQTRKELEKEYRREVSNDELADVLKIPREKLNEALTLYNLETKSLQDTDSNIEACDIHDISRTDNKLTSTEPTPEEASLKTEEREIINKVLDSLIEPRRTIAKLYFGFNKKGKNYTLKEIGNELNYSGERIRQLLGIAKIDIANELQNYKAQGMF